MSGKIIITPLAGGVFDVSQDGKKADGLTFDEMLGLVASLTMPETRPCKHWMKSEAEIANEKRYLNSIPQRLGF